MDGGIDINTYFFFFFKYSFFITLLVHSHIITLKAYILLSYSGFVASVVKEIYK